MEKKYSKKNIDSYNWLRAIPHYLTIFFALYPFYKLWFRIKIYGRENIPKGEGLIIASNHLSYFDPTIISLGMLAPVAYMSKQELFSVPVLKQFILMYGAFSVNREKLELSTIKTAKGLLKKGWHVGLFPEGTRGDGEIIGHIQNGMSYLAKTTKTRVLPFAIIGSNKKRGPITVKIGKPIEAYKDTDRINKEWLKTMTELTGLPAKDLLKDNNRQQESSKDLSLQNA